MMSHLANLAGIAQMVKPLPESRQWDLPCCKESGTSEAAVCSTTYQRGPRNPCHWFSAPLCLRLQPVKPCKLPMAPASTCQMALCCIKYVLGARGKLVYLPWIPFIAAESRFKVLVMERRTEGSMTITFRLTELDNDHKAH